MQRGARQSLGLSEKESESGHTKEPGIPSHRGFEEGVSFGL